MSNYGPARPFKGPEGQSQMLWAKQLAQEFASDTDGVEYGGNAKQLCEKKGFPVGSIALVHKAVRALKQLDAACDAQVRKPIAQHS